MNRNSAKRKEELEAELNRIVDVVISKYSPDKIILFGSMANGNVNEYSDIDLAIIKDTKERFINRLHEVRLMTHPQICVDFLVYTPKEVKDMQDEGRRFMIKEILKKGEVLYEKRQ